MSRKDNNASWSKCVIEKSFPFGNMGSLPIMNKVLIIYDLIFHHVNIFFLSLYFLFEVNLKKDHIWQYMLLFWWILIFATLSAFYHTCMCMYPFEVPWRLRRKKFYIKKYLFELNTNSANNCQAIIQQLKPHNPDCTTSQFKPPSWKCIYHLCLLFIML